LYDPYVLKRAALEEPLRVFLCGPGYESARYHFRDQIRSHLSSFPNVEVIYGEKIVDYETRIRRSDLLSFELQFANLVDFTILILETPGAIAELGTFSMDKNVRPRLFVMVPSRYYRSTSYISRGPLSLIGKEHLNNVIYYDETDYLAAINALQMPLVLFKFCNAIHPAFGDAAIHGYIRRERNTGYYSDIFARVKMDFLDTFVLMGIIFCEDPTFAALTAITQLSPLEIRRTLGRLFAAECIRHEAGGRYSSIYGFSDPHLKQINTAALSKLKAQYIAAA
jgi:hypothetical protein